MVNIAKIGSPKGMRPDKLGLGVSLKTNVGPLVLNIVGSAPAAFRTKTKPLTFAGIGLTVAVGVEPNFVANINN